MRREFSAGAVLVRRLRGEWVLAAIRPAGRPEGTWVLPKGQIDPGESGAEAAVRELAEETGVRGTLVSKLGDTRYWFSWERERVCKVVSFFLVRYSGGRLGAIPEEFRHEVAATCWLPLAEAAELLAYRGERELAAQALAMLPSGQDV